MAPQLMVMNGPLARVDRLCSSRAISSACAAGSGCVSPASSSSEIPFGMWT